MELAGEVGEYALSHGGTADVAMTAEKNFNHSFVSPCFAPKCPVLQGISGICEMCDLGGILAK